MLPPPPPNPLNCDNGSWLCTYLAPVALVALVALNFLSNRPGEGNDGEESDGEGSDGGGDFELLMLMMLWFLLLILTLLVLFLSSKRPLDDDFFFARGAPPPLPPPLLFSIVVSSKWPLEEYFFFDELPREVFRFELSMSLRRERIREFAGFVERCSVRVGYYVLLLVVAMKYGEGIAKAYRGVNEDVAIEYGS